jgi:predicted nuclease of predicted toxin-antitoxin system
VSDTPGLFIQIYTDEDVNGALAAELRERGYNAQSAAEADMLEQSDEAQLLYAASRNMAIMTRNEKDFVALAWQWAGWGRDHSGIIVSQPFSQEQFGELLRQTLHLLDTLTADDMRNAFVYLSQFR